MKFHWSCTNPKCMADNKTEVEDIFIGTDGSLLIDLGPCSKCGNPHRKLTIWNQRVSVEGIGVGKY